MGIQVNGLKSCDSCRNAIKDLQAAGQEVALRDFRADPPSRAEIAAWSDAVGLSILNTRSTTWRNLSEVERQGDSVDLMLAHPTLIKRPVIVADGAVSVGWTAAVKAALGL